MKMAHSIGGGRKYNLNQTTKLRDAVGYRQPIPLDLSSFDCAAPKSVGPTGYIKHNTRTELALDLEN